MLQKASNHSRRATKAAFDVTIAAVATAVPAYEVGQAEAIAWARIAFPHLAQLDAIYANTGVERRFSVEPKDWYYRPHGWEDRTESFQRNALALLEEAGRAAIAAAGVEPSEVGAIVVNTITGLAIPSLDAALVPRLGLKPTVERLPIFGLGCGGGVAGLARAVRMAATMPESHVLFLTVDLCSLCLRLSDPSKAMFVSGALFGDGAAAVMLRNGAGATAHEGYGHVIAIGEYLWPDTERVMGWDIKEDGFGIVLSPKLPALLQRELAPTVARFLSESDVAFDDLEGFLLHPGGRKVLEAAGDALDLPEDALAHSWDVLRDFGNMSSATALFVLDRAIRGGAAGRHLLAAFGPGFSAYFMILDLFV